MAVLITNIKKDNKSINKLIKTQTKRVVFITDKKDEQTELDMSNIVHYVNIRIDTIFNYIEDLSNLINGITDDIFIALEEDTKNLSIITYIVANALKVKGIYIIFDDNLVLIPKLQLKLSDTKKSLIKILAYKPLKSSEITEKMDITRAMVHNHLNDLISQFLVYFDANNKLYTLSESGKMLNTIFGIYKDKIMNMHEEELHEEINAFSSNFHSNVLKHNFDKSGYRENGLILMEAIAKFIDNNCSFESILQSDACELKKILMILFKGRDDIPSWVSNWECKRFLHPVRK